MNNNTEIELEYMKFDPKGFEQRMSVYEQVLQEICKTGEIVKAKSL
ncbi:MAG: hypothetical protein UC961_00100 [Emergencia sp.]|nr:hypothetical protein [Emergencia sp.]